MSIASIITIVNSSSLQNQIEILSNLRVSAELYYCYKYIWDTLLLGDNEVERKLFKMLQLSAYKSMKEIVYYVIDISGMKLDTYELQKKYDMMRQNFIDIWYFGKVTVFQDITLTVQDLND